MTDILPESEIINALESERHSETISMFHLTYPTAEIKHKSFVMRHWSLFRMHIDIDRIEICRNNTTVEIDMPEWLGGSRFEFNFWEDGHDAIVVDCIDLRLKYNYLSQIFVDNR